MSERSPYAVRLTRAAKKDLQRLPTNVRSRLVRKIELLATDPRPRGCRKLTTFTDRWRIRSGEYRIVYRIDDPDRSVSIEAVRNRKDAYE